MVAEHVAFMQLDKYDRDGQVINHWILLTVSVSCESNHASQDENYNNNQLEDIVFDVPTNCQSSDVKRNEGQWGRTVQAYIVIYKAG